MSAVGVPICKRCLLRDTADSVYYQSVLRYRKSLPARLALDDAAYAARVDACAGCEALQNGVCAHCGCYVEMRAARRDMACPAPRPRWQARGPQDGKASHP